MRSKSIRRQTGCAPSDGTFPCSDAAWTGSSLGEEDWREEGASAATAFGPAITSRRREHQRESMAWRIRGHPSRRKGVARRISTGWWQSSDSRRLWRRVPVVFGAIPDIIALSHHDQTQYNFWRFNLTLDMLDQTKCVRWFAWNSNSYFYNSTQSLLLHAGQPKVVCFVQGKRTS